VQEINKVEKEGISLFFNLKASIFSEGKKKKALFESEKFILSYKNRSLMQN